MLDFHKGTQGSPSSQIQFCTKSEEAIPGSGGQEWPSKLATNIE